MEHIHVVSVSLPLTLIKVLSQIPVLHSCLSNSWIYWREVTFKEERLTRLKNIVFVYIFFIIFIFIYKFKLFIYIYIFSVRIYIYKDGNENSCTVWNHVWTMNGLTTAVQHSLLSFQVISPFSNESDRINNNTLRTRNNNWNII